MDQPMNFQLNKKDIKLLYNIGYKKASNKFTKQIEHYSNSNNNNNNIFVLIMILSCVYLLNNKIN